MSTPKNGAAPGASAPDVIARRFAVQAETAIAGLEQRFPAGFGPVEQTQAEQIRAALARLRECTQRLARDGLMIQGSTRQLRPHQLLKTEQELRREIVDGLRKLAISAENRAMLEQARALTRKRREQA